MRAPIEVNGNGKLTKDKLKQKYALLPDEDLLLLEEKQEELFKRLQVKLGKTREEVRNIIFNF